VTYFRLLRSTRLIWIFAAALRSASRDSAAAALASFLAASLAARSRALTDRLERLALSASVRRNKSISYRFDLDQETKKR
jgi:hypothetical protein